MIAIEQTLEYIALSNNQNFIIYSDSLSAIESIEAGSTISRPTLLERLLSKYSKVKNQGKIVQIHWMPSHIGIQGNQRADDLAKTATQHQEIDIVIKKEIRDRYKEIDDITSKIWQARWDEGKTGRHCHNIQTTVGKAIKYS